MYVGFNEDREFSTADVLDALARQVPLSVAQREVVEALRDWMREGRAQSASFQEAQEAEQRSVRLELMSPFATDPHHTGPDRTDTSSRWNPQE
jgi:hypothetical protein